MKLFYSKTSPFARKVRIVALETGAATDIEEVEVDVLAPDSPVVEHNPLGKIPTLVLDDGSSLFDSMVICDYLDSLTPKTCFFPTAGELRLHALRLHALADGITEAVLGRRIEMMRPPEKQFQPLLDRYEAAIRRSLAAIDDESALVTDGDLSIGQVALVCALGYADLRYESLEWRHEHAFLAEWSAEMSKRASFIETAP